MKNEDRSGIAWGKHAVPLQQSLLRSMRLRLYLGIPCDDAREEALYRFNQAFPQGFTAYGATGHWEGKQETTLVLEVIVAKDLDDWEFEADTKCRAFAAWYRGAWGQDAVLYVFDSVGGELL